MSQKKKPITKAKKKQSKSNSWFSQMTTDQFIRMLLKTTELFEDFMTFICPIPDADKLDFSRAKAVDPTMTNLFQGRQQADIFQHIPFKRSYVKALLKAKGQKAIDALSDVYVTIHVEQQSNADPTIIHRVFKYKLGRYLEQYAAVASSESLKNFKLEVIYPIVFFTNNNVPKSIGSDDLFDTKAFELMPALRDGAIKFNVLQVSYDHFDTEQLKKIPSIFAVLGLRTPKHHNNISHIEFIQLYLDRIRKYYKSNNILWRTIYAFFANRLKEEDKVILKELTIKEIKNMSIEEVEQAVLKEYVPYADQIKMEGRQEGIQEGMQKGMQESSREFCRKILLQKYKKQGALYWNKYLEKKDIRFEDYSDLNIKIACCGSDPQEVLDVILKFIKMKFIKK